MDRLTIVAGAQVFDVVLRRMANDPWATWIIDRETAALTLLANHDLPVPRLLAADHTGDQAGVTCLLMTALPGEPLLASPDLADCLYQTARVLVRVHDLAPAGLTATDPYGLDEQADHAWIGDPALRRAVAEAAALPTSPSAPRLVHGDFHQLNILWSNQKISGIVDWTYTGAGFREIDVGHCRLMLAALFSTDAAEDFLRMYEAEAGVRIDPRADIRALLDFGPSWATFIPQLVAGRAPTDPQGMPARVVNVLHAALRRL
ncbi:phosphotransferase family protein [Actinopolymorpha pittospori]|uniref:Aminoglycoside phosphotransferase (APT) family kinase protein n=1 Tax=Actinopolymorpha pittospori TaxID=648752 RepID=A0A927N7W0_9ACTN|nr:aminoglycoside phosphotransferase family protein [Actinopolymorpha pittospori]MBE1612623.1 aminoglycoside phosphotransferase (APT) family kinase protein [Actinopolymorpha pittospori]